MPRLPQDGRTAAEATTHSWGLGGPCSVLGRITSPQLLIAGGDVPSLKL